MTEAEFFSLVSERLATLVATVATGVAGIWCLVGVLLWRLFVLGKHTRSLL